MANKKNNQKYNLKLVNDVGSLINSYLNTDEEFSLEIDPLNYYNFDKEEKDFIKNYCQYKNILLAADMSNIEVSKAKEIFNKYLVQEEIRRINRAMYHKSFAHKLLSLDDLGGYLSCLLTDENIPIGDRLLNKDKLKVVEQLIKLHELKQETLNDPKKIIDTDIEQELKELSVGSLKNLIKKSEENENKKEYIDKIKEKGGLSIEEEEFLKTLSKEELEKIIKSL